MRPPLRLLLAAVVVTALAVAGLVVLDPFADEPAPEREQPFTTTPLEGFATTTLTVPRAGFCDAVDPRQVEAALGDEPVDAQRYDNGDEVTLDSGLTDVVHEFGCRWIRSDQSEARAWVFAPPVGADRATQLVRAAGRGEACETSPAPAYGAPSVGVLCTGEGGGLASYRGLFGDAWLTCELSMKDPEVSGAELLRRTGAWCVGVAMAASAG